MENAAAGKMTKAGITTGKAALLVALCHTIWGFSPLFWKQLTSRLDAPYILCIRVVFTMLVCGIAILVLKKTEKVREALKNLKKLWIFPLCGAMLAANWGFYILAVHTERIVEGSLAYFLSPIITVVVGFLFFREKLSGWQWSAVVLAAAGVAVSVIAYGKVPYIAFLIAAPFIVYSAMKKLTDVDSVTALFLETLSMVPFALAFMIYSEINGTGVIENLSGAQYLLLPAAGVMTTVPLILLSLGIHKITYSLSGILTYINPSLEIIIGLVLYKEPFEDSTAVTFAFVWAALIIYTVSTFVKSKKKPAKT